MRFAFSRLQTDHHRVPTRRRRRSPPSRSTSWACIGFNAGPTRTAIGLAVNLPQLRNNDLYQIQDSLSYYRGNHSFKVGFDLRRIEVESFFNPTLRGRLVYPTLQRFVDDVAEVATINKPAARRHARSSTTPGTTSTSSSRTSGGCGPASP